VQIGVVQDGVEWLVYMRPGSGNGWDSVKVVANGRAPTKANYWLGWNGSRFASQHGLVMLLKRPVLAAGVEKLLVARAGADLL
jgi:hypothetical protein